MVCSAYFGMLSEKRKANWDNKETKPYEVLDNPINLKGKGHDVWHTGQEYFSDKIQIDWASYAWKSTSEQIIQFLTIQKTTLPWLMESEEEMIAEVKAYIKMHGNTEYGVVFIEES